MAIELNIGLYVHCEMMAEQMTLIIIMIPNRNDI